MGLIEETTTFFPPLFHSNSTPLALQLSPKVLKQPGLVEVLAPWRPVVDDCPIDPADTLINGKNVIRIFGAGKPEEFV